VSLNESLQKVVARHEELRELMLAPDVASSSDFVDMSKEYAELTPIVEAIANLDSAQGEAADLATMLADPETDPEMREMAEMEFQELKETIPALEKNIQIHLLPKDEADAKNAILEVRAGTGGEEAALFAADLFRMYQRYSETQGWKFEIMAANETGIGGLKEAVALGELSSGADCAKLAAFFWIGWEGAILRTKLVRNTSPVDLFADTFFAGLPR